MADPQEGVTAASDATADPVQLPVDQQALVTQVLSAEYALLMAALSTAWSASLVRTSLFLAIVSAAGLVLGFAAQQGLEDPTFTTLGLAVLPLVLFLGVATFARLVQVQREAIVYIVGQNRIRNYFQAIAPASRPYFVLPTSDDQQGVYGSIGTGMSHGSPRYRLLNLATQTQGIVGVTTAAVAAALFGLAGAQFAASAGAWIGGGGAFVVTIALLLMYWRRSLADIWSSVDPLFPTSDG